MSKIMQYVKRRILFGKLGIDSLTKISSLLSFPMGSGIFFLHQGRCGSTVLARVLAQHPKIDSYGEIFDRFFKVKRLPTKPEKMLQARRARAFPNHAVVEAKFFECQHLILLGLSISEFVNFVQQNGYQKFIILNRRNYLRKVISTKIGLERGGKFHYILNEEVPPTKIHLDVENVFIMGKTTSLVDLFKYMDEQYQKLRVALAGQDVLELTYEEDILNDPVVAYNKVCHWLDIESVPVDVDLRRTNSMGLNDTVKNWDEVVEVLEGTQYGWMVE